MISLISVWNLKKGCPPELEEELKKLAGKVKKAEADTLMYEVNLQAPFPTDSNFNPLVPPPDPILLNKQKNITFIEVYKNVEAFSIHVQGEVFTKFRVEFLKDF
jgi:quinol monooxygenase YgiN